MRGIDLLLRTLVEDSPDWGDEPEPTMAKVPNVEWSQYLVAVEKGLISAGVSRDRFGKMLLFPQRQDSVHGRFSSADFHSKNGSTIELSGYAVSVSVRMTWPESSRGKISIRVEYTVDDYPMKGFRTTWGSKESSVKELTPESVATAFRGVELRRAYRWDEERRSFVTVTSEDQLRSLSSKRK